MTRRAFFPVVLTAIMLAGPTAARAADETGIDPQQMKEVLERAADYLKSHQEANGSFSPKAGPGITAVVVAGMLRCGFRVDDPVVRRGLAYLEKSVKKDGGIYDKGLANYTTSVGIMALQEANKDGKYDTIIKNATTYLKKLQYDVEETDVRFGGVDYGDKKKLPDMSNTQYYIEALIAAGVPKDDPSLQRAIKFVSRCQNLPGETNDQPFAKKTTAEDKGGLVYVPDPDDKRHKTPEGGLRSLGGMTYGGLKSFLYAGVKKDDPRVKGAVDWIRRHYTLDENPGMGQAGLFYYYPTFGKAMAALAEDRFEDAKGTKHDWRRELFETLKKRQRDDGSFINKTDKQFGEADPNLATAFALLALSYTKPPKN